VLVGFAFQYRRDAAVALLAHAVALPAVINFGAPSTRRPPRHRREVSTPDRWSVNLFYVLLYANILPLVAARSSSPTCAPRSIRPSRDNFCGELRPRRRRRLSARLMRILSGEPVPTERLATYNDTRQIFAD